MDFKVDHIVYKEGNVDLYLKVTMIGTSNVHHSICAWPHHAHAMGHGHVHGVAMGTCVV